MEKSSSAKELFTPEALRRVATGHGAPTRPGERSSPTKSNKSSEGRSPTKGPKPTKLRKCSETMSFVPWWALMSLGLLIAGIAIFAIKGRKATDAAQALLQSVNSNIKAGFPQYMDIYETSFWVTIGVAAAATLAVFMGACVRLDQKLRKKGRYSPAKGGYGDLAYNFFTFFTWVGMLLTMLLAMWAVVLGVMMAAWSVQCWNLEKGTSVTITNIAALNNLNSQYGQALGEFADALGSKNATEEAIAMEPLEQLAKNWQEVAIPSAYQPAEDGVCPSVACLNMAYYPFMESSMCVCTLVAIENLNDLAADSSKTANWALYGIACLFAGALLGAMELSTDVSMLAADQLFLRVIKRKSSSRGSSRRREGEGGHHRRTESEGHSFRIASPGHSIPGLPTAMMIMPTTSGNSNYMVHANASFK